MIVYALYGKEKIGKTTVIKSVCEKLEKNYTPVFSKNYSEDICRVFKIDDKMVGITSYGDNEDVLKEPFDTFKKCNCEIILTASRIRYTKSGSALTVYNFCKDNGINKPEWIKKDYVEARNKDDYSKQIDEIN